MKNEEWISLFIIVSIYAIWGWFEYKKFKNFFKRSNYKQNHAPKYKEKPEDILNVKKTASKNDIKKAYYRKAKETHPDHGGTKEKFIKVQWAYETLYATA